MVPRAKLNGQEAYQAVLKKAPILNEGAKRTVLGWESVSSAVWGVSLLPEGDRNVSFTAKEAISSVSQHSSRGGRRMAVLLRSIKEVIRR